MLTPKYPHQDIAPRATAPVREVPAHGSVVPASAAPLTNRPTVQLTPGSALALAAGGGAVVLVVGAVLVSMLLAVAITGVSVALVAVVLRLLLKDLAKQR
ncbi:SpdD protein [Streptomyces tendae]|uniref:SpdD protein n=1 Tax=Streptomyces tendae TaxID=1932 RepID=UPI003669DE96